MIANQIALIKREIWEHRAIYVTPAAIGLVMIVMTLTGQISVAAYGDVVDMAIVGASNVDEAHRRAFIMSILAVVTMIFAIGAGIVMTFYSLDALYAERKDKSILFWRSLPITDAETVISKLITASLVIPAVTLVATYVTHFVILLFGTIQLWFEGGNAGHLIWGPAPIFDVWASSFIIAFAITLWMAPYIGWFFFVSGFTKRSPLLMALLPVIIAPMIEKMLMDTTFLWDAIFMRPFRPPLTTINFTADFDFDHEDFALSPESVSLLDQIDMGHFFSSPSLWAGLVVCGLFVFGAIYVRRFRDDS